MGDLDDKEDLMEEEKKVNDVKRYAQRLGIYLSGLEKITGIIEKHTQEESFKVDRLLEKMLPHLNKIFNSGIAFVADENRKIIKSIPESSLEKIIPEIFIDILTNSSKEDIFVISNTTQYIALKDLNIDSIMALKSRMQGKILWIGICNGKNEPEPYLGEDKKFFKYIINFFYSVYEFVLNSEQSHVLNQYRAADIDGNWSELARTSGELVEKYNDINYLPDFLDAGLCNSIHQHLLHKGNQVVERGKILIIEKNGKKDYFKVQNSEGKEFIEEDISIIDHKRAALAGARGLLYDILIGFDDKSTSNDTAEITKSKVGNYQEWVKIIIDQTSYENNIDKNDFEYHVDWLRTQWLRIYYLALSSNRQPKKQSVLDMRRIYSEIRTKTISVIQEHIKGNDSILITINSDWLWAFLAQNILLSRNLTEHYHILDSNADDCNLLTVSHFFKHFSQFMLYILHYIRFAQREAEYNQNKKDVNQNEHFVRPPFADIPFAKGSSLSSSIIFMISEYAYREIGVPRELLIFEKLSQQLNFELPLYAANEFYRDHCYHVIDVCLLGEFLLICNTSLLKNKSKKIIFRGLKDTNWADVLKNWYIAALCHDLGYVVERADKLVGPIEKLEGLEQFNIYLKDGLKAGKSELKEKIDLLCSEKDLGIMEELKKKIDERIDKLDHGIIGWLYLCQLLKKLKIPLLPIKPALTAILRHNLCEHDETIHEEILSLLLILCDHLQEWGRPRVATEQLATGIMENMRFSSHESYFDRQIHLNQFSIEGLRLQKRNKKDLPRGICNRCIKSSLCEKSQKCFRLWPEILDKGVEFQLVYHGDRTANFEPVLTWLFFCHDFQCQKLPFGKYLFPIAIHFSHPQSSIPLLAKEDISELDIFEEFANKKEEAAYLCQWIECARKNKEGIKYLRGDDTGNKKIKDEQFIIHLNELGQPLARGLHRQHGKDFIDWKKKWQTEKYIAGNFGG